jgi:glycine C-acetyltransferase
LAELRQAGLYKHEHVIETPQSAHVGVTGRGEVLNLCANNYLGLADHPEIVAAAHAALERWGYGMASVRFICGTQEVHRELERRLAEFLGSEAAILYSSCFDANGGLSRRRCWGRTTPCLDALNRLDHRRHPALQGTAPRYANRDLTSSRLSWWSRRRYRLIATDGVRIRPRRRPGRDRTGERHDAGDGDDPHAVGFVGEQGRGTHDCTT